MAPAGQRCDRLQAENRLVAARSTDHTNDGRQLPQIDRHHFGQRSARRIETRLLAHYRVVGGRRRRHVRRHVGGCNHILGLTGCCVYANYAAGNFIGAGAHTCDAIEQRLLVVVGAEDLQHGGAEVFVDFVGRTFAVDLRVGMMGHIFKIQIFFNDGKFDS